MIGFENKKVELNINRFCISSYLNARTKQDTFRLKVAGLVSVAVTTMLVGRFCPPYMVDRFEILRFLQKLKSKLGAFPALGKAESGPTATTD